MFPPQSPSYILQFQFSSWYPKFSTVSVKSTIIKPLPEDFADYLNEDSVFLPEGSEDIPASSSLSDMDDEEGEDSDSDSDDKPRRTYTFPDLDSQIRDCIQRYDGAVFPKLNFSSPRDASWMLPSSSPLKCMSPADVYLLLKSSDFASHDISPELVFDGQAPGPNEPYELELVLRKWYAMDRSREMRCFVRAGRLIGISQRDTNHYPYMSTTDVQQGIVGAITRFWTDKVCSNPRWEVEDYIFDILLTRDLSRAHIVDFNPYAPRTDSLMFSYEELDALHRLHTNAEDTGNPSTPPPIPQFKYVDSPAHPFARSNAPAHQHNMVPLEALSLSSGRDIAEFAEVWREEVARGTRENDDD
ncbi:D123-domain-containing protein [Schizophyllum amplum]|uniref:D123-domain-containing protein n=1 Tax=Schizophyllum amplum TaxID=97359 RepID=A0A550CDL3_9AGAR|nr:D123-domain-containing protein [Auriculariopsis ampla]